MVDLDNFLSIEEMLKEISPIAGYAPGGYYITCTKCGRKFDGDKRASQCLPCAIKDITAPKNGDLLPGSNSCASCKYSFFYEGNDWGACRRRSPNAGLEIGEWPSVKRSCWCGDFADRSALRQVTVNFSEYGEPF